jgi:hydroxyethylthiazole kinase
MVEYDLKSLLKKLRDERPLVHNITNYVVMNFTANTLLAMGASPVMAHAADEVEEMVSLAGALVINIGTLSKHWIESMLRAGRRANELGVPIILDPVGSGATSLRTNTFRNLVKELRLSVVRGNGSEILSIASDSIRTKGVETAHGAEQALETAREVATAAGLAFFGLAGEHAGTKTSSPGSFLISLLDALYEITPAEFQAQARLETV